MRSGNRNIRVAIENIIDIFVNILSIFVGYVLALLVSEGSVLDIMTAPVIILIALVLGASSFTYQAFNLYARLLPVYRLRRLQSTSAPCRAYQRIDDESCLF